MSDAKWFELRDFLDKMIDSHPSKENITSIHVSDSLFLLDKLIRESSEYRGVNVIHHPDVFIGKSSIWVK
jgi:hypothetical protein